MSTMTKPEYFEFAARFFESCLTISKAKNADYTGGAADPFANFKAVEQYGVSAEQGFITRMSDKMMRISSFVKMEELQVKDESVTDTLRDLANYACLLAGYIESKKGQPAFTVKVETSDEFKTAIMDGQAIELKTNQKAKCLCINTACTLHGDGKCKASQVVYALCKIKI